MNERAICHAHKDIKKRGAVSLKPSNLVSSVSLPTSFPGLWNEVVSLLPGTKLITLKVLINKKIYWPT